MLDGIVPRHSDYLDAIFSELIDAAAVPGLKERLSTTPLAPERREAEFSRLRSLRSFGDGPVYLTSGGFLARFSDASTNWLCVTSEQLNTADRELLEEWAEREDLIASDIDETTFLFLTHAFRGLYRVKAANITREAATNILDIGPADGGPILHNPIDLIDVFEHISVFQIPKDSLYNTWSDFAIAARLASTHPRYRSQLISQDAVASLSMLIELPNIPPDNLYFALTASHWKYAFLEIYKIIEALFFLPWAMSVRKIVRYEGSAYELAREIRSALPLVRKEADAIRELFGMASDVAVGNDTLNEVACFSELTSNREALSGAYAERIYTIRNQLVHQLEQGFDPPIEVTVQCWPKLVSYLADIAVFLYSAHSTEININFNLKEGESTRHALE